MATNYDSINKFKEKYNKQISALQSEILLLKSDNEKLKIKINELRKQMYDSGEGKGEINKLKSIIHAQDVENKTLSHLIRELDGSKFISSFDIGQQNLIKNIKNLKFANSNYNALATKFKNGLDTVIELAFLIKNKCVKDLDFYTYVFRDNIVGLFEKMLYAIIGVKEDSASKYLVGIVNNKYDFPNDYKKRLPFLQNEKILQNILNLVNLESTAYHGTKSNRKHIIIKDNQIIKEDRFLNLDTLSQLEAIFSLLEFMYDVFTNIDKETNLLIMQAEWFKTI